MNGQASRVTYESSHDRWLLTGYQVGVNENTVTRRKQCRLGKILLRSIKSAFGLQYQGCGCVSFGIRESNRFRGLWHCQFQLAID